MLVVLLVRGLTLPGAVDGIKFYLYPDPTRLVDPQVSIKVKLLTQIPRQAASSISSHQRPKKSIHSYSKYSEISLILMFWHLRFGWMQVHKFSSLLGFVRGVWRLWAATISLTITVTSTCSLLFVFLFKCITKLIGLRCSNSFISCFLKHYDLFSN